METYSFQKLEAYQQARRLVVDVYRIIAILPMHEKFALANQLRRAIVSDPSNIAEGSGRISYKEKVHFLEISFGSLMEAFCQLEICRDLNYITEETLKEIKPKFFLVSRLINALRQSFINKLTREA